MPTAETWAKMSENCAKKKVYATHAKAKTAMSFFAAKRQAKGTHAYKCLVCEHWHITTCLRERGNYK